MGVSRFETLEEVFDYFVQKGSKLNALFKKDGTEIRPVTRIPGVKERVEWVCASNKEHIQHTTFGNVLRNDRDQLLCKVCGIANGKHRITYEDFTKLLDDNGWMMNDKKANYKNCMSLVNVICSNGHKTQTSQNRFSNGHRCAECMTNNMRKHTIEDIRGEFREKGFELLSTEYKNNSTPLDYKCKCGRKGKITYSNFTKNIDGCMSCTRRWTIQGAKDYMEEVGCDFVSVDSDEFVLNSNHVTYICTCGNEWQNNWRCFREGARCKECTFDRVKEMWMDKYGVDNPSKSEEIKQKIVATMVELYGVEYAMQSKELAKKSVETNMKNHGGIHNLNLPDMREMSKKAYEDKYGAPFGFVEEHNEKGREATRKNLGVDYPFQSEYIHELIRKSVKEKYGVSHIMHVPEISDRAFKNSVCAKLYTFPSGNTAMVQGYEPYALNRLLSQGIDESDIITDRINVPKFCYWFEDVNRVYYPDIYIRSTNTIIEVKSLYTYTKEIENNMAKFIAVKIANEIKRRDDASDEEYNFKLWVFMADGELCIEGVFIGDMFAHFNYMANDE